MAAWAKFADGATLSEGVFRALARFAPDGTMDVFASDQHGSYLRLLSSYLEHVGAGREANDDDVREICRRFAAALEGTPSAALFNHLAYLSEGFRDLLGPDVMLIGRLEDTVAQPTADGRGLLARLAVEPEDVADRVDGFKTLVKLDPDHAESWQANRDWLADVFERSQKLDKPLFNETLLLQREGESPAEFAARLPEGVVRMAEEFGPYGHFYKTQVPVLWTQDDEGAVRLASSPDEVRAAAVAMHDAVNRPMLLLSAAVDFEQYAAQYALVCDQFCGPMCGRAYFKEAFTLPETRDMDSLAASFGRLALPRMRQIRGLAERVSLPWWEKFTHVEDEARALLRPDARPEPGVRADYGY